MRASGRLPNATEGLPDARETSAKRGTKIVKFINPVGYPNGDSEGVIIDRYGDTLVVDTGVDRLSVPIKLVFDGKENIPELPATPTLNRKAFNWVKKHRGAISGGGVAAAVITGLLLLFMTPLVEPTPVITFEQANVFMNGLPIEQMLAGMRMVGVIPFLLGIAKMVLSQSSGEDTQGAFLYIGGGVLFQASITVIEKVFFN